MDGIVTVSAETIPAKTNTRRDFFSVYQSLTLAFAREHILVFLSSLLPARQMKAALQTGNYQAASWYWRAACQAVCCNHLCSFLCMFRKGFTLSFQHFYKSSGLGPAFFCGKLTKLDSLWTCKPWPHSYSTWATLRSWFFWCLFFLIWNNSYFPWRKPCLLMTASCNMPATILRSSPMALSHLIHHPQTWGQRVPWSGGKNHAFEELNCFA